MNEALDSPVHLNNMMTQNPLKPNSKWTRQMCNHSTCEPTRPNGSEGFPLDVWYFLVNPHSKWFRSRAAGGSNWEDHKHPCLVHRTRIASELTKKDLSNKGWLQATCNGLRSIGVLFGVWSFTSAHRDNFEGGSTHTWKLLTLYVKRRWTQFQTQNSYYTEHHSWIHSPWSCRPMTISSCTLGEWSGVCCQARASPLKLLEFKGFNWVLYGTEQIQHNGAMFNCRLGQGDVIRYIPWG